MGEVHHCLIDSISIGVGVRGSSLFILSIAYYGISINAHVSIYVTVSLTHNSQFYETNLLFAHLQMKSA